MNWENLSINLINRTKTGLKIIFCLMGPLKISSSFIICTLGKPNTEFAIFWYAEMKSTDYIHIQIMERHNQSFFFKGGTSKV